MRRAAATLSLLLVVQLAIPASSFAHGLVNRRDLPLPPWLFAWAAIVVLVASFLALSSLWRTPRLTKAPTRSLTRVPTALDLACGVFGVLLFAFVIYCGFAGNQVGVENVVPTFVYVVFWVGIPVTSALFGNWFSVFNPWVSIARCVTRFAGGRLPDGLPWKRDYPEWLGRWPAAIGLFVFVLVELALPSKTDPSTLATLAIVYAIVQWIGMSFFGIDEWTEKGDAFAGYFELFGRIAPIGRNGKRLILRAPLTALPSLPALAGLVAMLAVMIGTTSFDGFTNGQLWQTLLPSLDSIFSIYGSGGAAQGNFVYAAGICMFLMVALVAGLYLFGVRGMTGLGEGHKFKELARGFAHSLVPIAFAYVVAHYLTLLLYQGQAMFHLASDPLGRGSDLFGTASVAVDYSLVGGGVMWYVQVVVLLVGHVAGLVLAHDRALVVYRDPRHATQSQYWMLLVMGCFTSLALWLLSDLAQ